jgi:Phage tail assembly chaperone protein
MHTIQVNVSTGEKVLIPYTTEQQAEYDTNKAAWDAGANDRKAAEVRTERNEKITACDWRVLPDVSNSDAWKVYRQALRDVPMQLGFPNNVVWPDAP